MKRTLALLLLLLSSNCLSNTKFSIFFKTISISDKCTYFVRDITSAGFSCSVNDEYEYRIRFQTPAEIKKNFAELNNTFNGALKESAILDMQIHKVFGKYDHFYYVFSGLNPEFTLYNYQICDYQACIDINSTNKNLVIKVINKFDMEYIDGN